MMANTYTQIHIQAVFAVRNRECLIGNDWKTDLYKYITGIVDARKDWQAGWGFLSDRISLIKEQLETQLQQ